MHFSAEERTAENVSGQICKELQEVFGDKISDIKVDDMEDDDPDGNYPQFFPRFVIKFLAYDYFTVFLAVEGSQFNCGVVYMDVRYVPLIQGRHYYTDEDFRECLAQISEEIALRIPDKFLRSRGWL